MTDLTFREAEARDVPGIVALMRDDRLGATREGDPDDPAYARAFAGIDAHPGVRILLAFDGDRLVGCLQLILIPSLSHRGLTRAQLESVRTASDRRGEGIGAALVAHAVEVARRAGAGLAQLTSHAEREAAHRFWVSQGFTLTHAGFKMDLRGTPR